MGSVKFASSLSSVYFRKHAYARGSLKVILQNLMCKESGQEGADGGRLRVRLGGRFVTNTQGLSGDTQAGALCFPLCVCHPCPTSRLLA